MSDEPIKVSVPVLSRQDAKYAPRHVVERAVLPPMPWRRSDTVTACRVIHRASVRRELGPYLRVVITP